MVTEISSLGTFRAGVRRLQHCPIEASTSRDHLEHLRERRHYTSRCGISETIRQTRSRND
ncbi:hypothetical protein [Amycolatopsis sp. Hca4]|uniref:hypothetical protein n=1 Tax=Amycolatopsis sp. Hca4 TaxID=2742131 RepID=UPI00158FA834|nr:hypothetical protein [Amycolatopsis sp. Hca4]QKV74081.1 hypothetical protein HUT10_10080 [Amycolatopsis sp. Hca4]